MSFVGAGATIGNLGQRAAHHRTRMFSSPGPRLGGPPCLRKKTGAPVIASGDIGGPQGILASAPRASGCNVMQSLAAPSRCGKGRPPPLLARRRARVAPSQTSKAITDQLRPRSRHPRHACGAQRAGHECTWNAALSACRCTTHSGAFPAVGGDITPPGPWRSRGTALSWSVSDPEPSRVASRKDLPWAA